MQGPCWVPNPQQAEGTAACAAPAPSAASAAGTLPQRPARVSHPVSQASTCVGQLSHLRRATTPHKLIKTLPALTSCFRTHLETRFVQERSLRSGLPARNAEESTENSAARSTSSAGKRARGAVRPGHAPGRHRGHAPRRPQGPEQMAPLLGMRDRREAAATGSGDTLRPLQALLWEGGQALEQELGRASPGTCCLLCSAFCVVCWSW